MCIMTIFNHITTSVYCGTYLLQHTGGGFLPGIYSWFLAGWHSQSAMTIELPWEWGSIAAAPFYR